MIDSSLNASTDFCGWFLFHKVEQLVLEKKALRGRKPLATFVGLDCRSDTSTSNIVLKRELEAVFIRHEPLSIRAPKALGFRIEEHSLQHEKSRSRITVLRISVEQLRITLENGSASNCHSRNKAT